MEAQYGTDADEAWFVGKVMAVNADGTCDVHYEDGDKEAGKLWSRVRAAAVDVEYEEREEWGRARKANAQRADEKAGKNAGNKAQGGSSSSSSSSSSFSSFTAAFDPAAAAAIAAANAYLFSRSTTSSN